MQKRAGIQGHLGRCWCVWQTVGSALDENSFHRVANRRDGCTMVPFLRPKRKFRLGEPWRSVLSRKYLNLGVRSSRMESAVTVQTKRRTGSIVVLHEVKSQ